MVSRVFVCFCGLGFKVVGCGFNLDTVYGARSGGMGSSGSQTLGSSLRGSRDLRLICFRVGLSFRVIGCGLP